MIAHRRTSRGFVPTVVGLTLALAGCYSPRLGSPGFHCHPEDSPACPEGQACLASRCVNPGQVPDGGGLDGPRPADAAAQGDLAGADLKTSADGPAVCALRINEVQTAGNAGASDEFVELFSSCGGSTALSGYKLVYRSAAGTTDTVFVTFTTQTIGSYFVCGQTSFPGTAGVRYTASMAATGGGLALLDGAGAVVDSVGFGNATNAFVRGTPAPAPGSAQSIKRLPDGNDSGNNATDFTIATTPTPGAATQ
jgi:hypothetical protein